MGKSSMTTKAARGQTVRTDYPRDDSSHSLPNTKGGSLGGSDTNLSHSISGGSAEQDGNASKQKKNRFS